jgi:hypothetical protein
MDEEYPGPRNAATSLASEEIDSQFGDSPPARRQSPEYEEEEEKDEEYKEEKDEEEDDENDDQYSDQEDQDSTMGLKSPRSAMSGREDEDYANESDQDEDEEEEENEVEDEFNPQFPDSGNQLNELMEYMVCTR